MRDIESKSRGGGDALAHLLVVEIELQGKGCLIIRLAVCDTMVESFSKFLVIINHPRRYNCQQKAIHLFI